MGDAAILEPPIFVRFSLFLIPTHSKNLIYPALMVQKGQNFGRPHWQRWSPREHILKSLALASKVKSLALASRPHVLENWPVLGSRTALFFELLKFCGALEKVFGIRFFVEIA